MAWDGEGYGQPTNSVSLSASTASQIQTALNSLGSYETLWVRAGTVDWNQSIAIPANKRMVGERSASGTRLVTLNGAGRNVQITGAGANVTVKGFILTNTNTTWRTLTAAVNFRSPGSAGSLCQDNEISYNQMGVTVGTGGRIWDNLIHHNQWYGANGGDAASPISVLRNEFHNNRTVARDAGDEGATKFVFQSNSEFAYNWFHDEPLHGLWLDVGNGASGANNVHHNLCENVASIGLFSEQGWACNIYNNWLRNCGAGITLTRVQDNYLYDNQIDDCGTSIWCYWRYLGPTEWYYATDWDGTSGRMNNTGHLMYRNIIRSSGGVLGRYSTDGSYLDGNNQWYQNTYMTSSGYYLYGGTSYGTIPWGPGNAWDVSGSTRTAYGSALVFPTGASLTGGTYGGNGGGPTVPDITVPLYINAGGPLTTSGALTFEADDTEHPNLTQPGGGTAQHYTGTIDLSDPATPAGWPQSLWYRERWGETVWTFPGLDADTDYLLILSWAENYTPDVAIPGTIDSAGDRVFSVTVNGATIDSGIDVYAAVGPHAAYTKQYTVTSDGDGQIEVGFVASVQNPLINVVAVTGAAAEPRFGDVTVTATEPTVTLAGHSSAGLIVTVGEPVVTLVGNADRSNDLTVTLPTPTVTLVPAEEISGQIWRNYAETGNDGRRYVD